MFKRLPYISWLVAAILLWLFVAYRHYRHEVLARPAAMAKAIGEDLLQRQMALQSLLKNENLFKRMFDGKLTAKEVSLLAKEPFYIYAFEDSADLVFWNSNIVVTTCASADAKISDGRSLYSDNGIYIKHCIHPSFLADEQSLVVLIPISVSYPFQNEYLQSSFVAADYIPPATKITTSPTAGSYAVYNKDGKPVFYLDFPANPPPQWMPDAVMVTGLFAALLCSFVALNLTAIMLVRKKSFKYGLAFLLGVLATVLTLLYTVGLPFYLDTLPIFSPLLYAANAAFPSLGMLLVVTLFFFWIVVFAAYNIPPADKNDRLKFVKAFILLGLIAFVVSVPVDIIRSLIHDSKISFDVANFYSVTIYTIVGLFAVVVIFSSMALMVHVCNERLSQTIALRWKYLLLIVALALSCYLSGAGNERWVVAGSLLLFMALLDFSAKTDYHTRSLFSVRIIVWLVLIAISATSSLEYFNSSREREQRVFFAENIVHQRDEMMEYLFADIGTKISNDKLINNFLAHPDEDNRPSINEAFSNQYLRGQLAHYQTNVYFYNAEGKPLYNSDSTSFHSFASLIENALATYSPYLYFNDEAKDGHYYIASIPILYKDSGLLGSVVLDMSIKKTMDETVYPELLQPGYVRDVLQKNNFSYAIYSGKELVAQTNDYPFAPYLTDDTLKVGEEALLQKSNPTIINYKSGPQTTVTLLDTHKHWLEVITICSYLMGMMMVMILCAFLLQLIFRRALRTNHANPIFRLTLRRRILFAILSVVLLSFIVIGFITTIVFVDKFDDTGRAMLRASMQAVERSIQQYLKDNNITPDPVSFHAEADNQRFRNFIINLSAAQHTDINIYNSYGSLKATSQEDIYNKSLLARIMMPDAYYQMSDKGSNLLVEKERVGKLNYLSAYMPLKNKTGENIGYINLPFFSSQKELNFQISNVLVALINLYAFIFIIASIIAVFISNLLTKGLQMIIEQFQKFNLTKNETIAWAHDDEIGLLVGEYNNMVRKVEENAALLAKSERETAWREMARQVAHEIKNPLTPMKLNIQYLQNALRANHPNTKDLTAKVSASLMEQIDNLSHIASAFSDFAKMPEAAPDNINLYGLMQKAMDLYSNDKRITLHFRQENTMLHVFADRSQLLRVITNLMQNAIEAIPDGKPGVVDVTVKQDGSKVIITIKDNGTGIAQEMRERIFNPYFTTKSSGTGLGLAMTKKIIEFWNGSIWFDTEEEKGTAFTIMLPLV